MQDYKVKFIDPSCNRQRLLESIENSTRIALKSSKNRATYKINPIPALAPDGCVIKEYNYSFLKALIKTLLFRPDRALQAYNGSKVLERIGLCTAKPLLLLERKKWGITLASTLVLEFIPNAIDLDQYLINNFFAANKLYPEKRALLNKLALDLSKMHRSGVYNRDMKIENIVLDPCSVTIYHIDLDGISSPGYVFKRLRTHNLAQLAASIAKPISCTDRARFLKVYCNSISSKRFKLKKYSRWIRQIITIARARKHHWP